MIDEDITLRKLEMLVAFVQTGNLARTADKLNLSTVSVHRALHTLEEGVRCPLFKHEGRTLKPLPAAFLLAEVAQDLLRGLETGLHKAREQAGFDGALLKMGAMYSLTISLVPQLVIGVKRRRPGLEIELTLGSNAELLGRLLERHLDVTVMARPTDKLPVGIEALPLFVDDLLLASPVHFALPTASPVNLRDLRQEKFVSLTEGFATQAGFEAAFQRAAFKPEIVLRVNDIFSLMNLVGGGVGHTLLPGRVRHLSENRIRFTPLLPQYQVPQTISLLFHKNQERYPNILALVAEARKIGRLYAAVSG